MTESSGSGEDLATETDAEPTSGNVLHDIGELIELRASSTIANINAFLRLGWVLLRIAEGNYAFLLGWRRTRGAALYPAWHAAEQREREALLEALRASEADEIALE